jgi:cell division septation protein DedD
LAQDDYYYEIQLTNKQLVFYFLAGATGLILSFLAGVMVGRGVSGEGDLQAAQPVREERIVSEEPRPAPPPAEDLTYAKTLEGERVPEAALDRPRPTPPPTTRPTRRAATPTPAPATRATPAPTPPPTTRAAAPPTTAAAAPPTTAAPAPRPTPTPAKAAPAAGLGAAGTFSIQVGAFKEKSTADSLSQRLKAKGFPAFVVAPETPDGLYNVRVGAFTTRADAERVQARLRQQEKSNPFIVKQ